MEENEDMKEKRRLIGELQRNESLTPAERARKMFEIMNPQKDKKRTNPLDNPEKKNDDNDSDSDSDFDSDFDYDDEEFYDDEDDDYDEEEDYDEDEYNYEEDDDFDSNLNSEELAEIQNLISAATNQFPDMNINLDKKGSSDPPNKHLDPEYQKRPCPNYKRGCIKQCPNPDCLKWVCCRICHDEKEKDHHLERTKVNKIICNKCFTEQPPSPSCLNCSLQFSRNYCDICKLWTDNDNVHCDKCQNCRRGTKETITHCDTCGICSAIEHVCIPEYGTDNCPICMEKINESISGVMILPICRHYIHRNCLLKYVVSNYKCPICSMSLCDMSDAWKELDAALALEEPMPDPYDKWTLDIQCYDCKEKNRVPYRPDYFKCPNAKCGSYNTQKLATHQWIPPPTDQAPTDQAPTDQAPTDQAPTV
jgi:RING finger/CHY zinc finger protein 1